LDDRKIGKRNRSHVCLVSEIVVPSASSFFTVLLAAIFLCTPTMSVSQSQATDPTAVLPEAPEPQIIKHERSKGGPCRVVPRSESSGAAVVASAAVASISLAGMSHESASTQPPIPQTALPPCPPPPLINWFARFLNGPEVKPLTPAEKARLAVRNLLDPFNAVTILGNAAIGIGSDSHSPYGPGMPGFGRYVGVSYSQDMTGEFFNTFLIPSVVHQDPHYHRMPHASIPRRIGHAIVQVLWTQGDDGKGMLNYANLIGNAIDDEIGNLYIPGRETNLSASAARYGIGLAIAPTDNFITEFIPDFAKRIHVRVVLVQRIIDQVAKTNGGGT
jgi:hypothetical protein